MPSHVSLLIFEENINVEDLALAVAFCLAMGISCVSICMKTGFVSEMKESLSAELHKKKEYLKSELKLHTEEIGVTVDGIQIPNHCKYRVHLISPASGRKYLVDCAKRLSTTIPSSEISMEIIDKHIEETTQLSEPQLAIKFGKVDSLLGVCPWQFRATEIISRSTLRKFGWSQMTSILESFGRTEQRWGK